MNPLQTESWSRYAATQVPELRLEALVQQALAGTGRDAVHKLAEVCGLDPFNGDWPALLSRAVAGEGRPELALDIARSAMQRFPLHTGLRRQYWGLYVQLPLRDRLALIRQNLPHVASGAELKTLIGLLPSPLTEREACWGVVEYHAPRRELRGWALNLLALDTPARLRVDTGQGHGYVLADRPHPLLAQAGLSQVAGGFQVRLPGPISSLSVHFEHGPELLGSPLAAIDGVRSLQTGLGANSNVAEGRPLQMGGFEAAARPPAAPVDILIPVYKGYQATLDCVQSVLDAQALNRTQHHIVVLDDASPEPRLAAALQAMGAEGRIQYVRQEANLGFIRNMNRGMALHPERDVVWLNADTRVQGDWLDRLQAAAYVDAHTASATPFSNNGELMGFPEPRVAADMPGARALAELDRCAAQLKHSPIPLPVGCGFCFYIKRAALDAVGLLDEVYLRRGYGEETDWCLRARQGGWQHVGVPTVFVAHAGGASFGEEKVLRAAQNNAVIRRRFPYAEDDYQAFLARDPLAAARAALSAVLQGRGLDSSGVALAASRTLKKKPASRAANAVPRRPRLQTTCAAWVILDAEAAPATGAQWLALARNLAQLRLRGKDSAHLLALKPSVWQPQWQATGSVTVMPELLGLSLTQRLQLWGAGAAVSLQPQPDAYSLQAASDCGLPVYAPDTPAWRAAGAWALSSLPGLNDVLASPATDGLRRQPL